MFDFGDVSENIVIKTCESNRHFVVEWSEKYSPP